MRRQMRIGDIVDEDLQISEVCSPRADVFELVAIEIGAHHFLVMISQRAQINTGAKTDFEGASWTFVRAFGNPGN